MVIDQVLPDGHGVAPPANGLDDQLAIELAGAIWLRTRDTLRGNDHTGIRKYLQVYTLSYLQRRRPVVQQQQPTREQVRLRIRRRDLVRHRMPGIAGRVPGPPAKSVMRPRPERRCWLTGPLERRSVSARNGGPPDYPGGSCRSSRYRATAPRFAVSRRV